MKLHTPRSTLTDTLFPYPTHIRSQMNARRAGQIANVGSIFGSINYAHVVTYSSAKAGLKGFSEALRRECGNYGVDVTYIAPRAVKTALNTPVVMRFAQIRSEEHTSELQSLMRISYAVFCLKKTTKKNTINSNNSKVIKTWQI